MNLVCKRPANLVLAMTRYADKPGGLSITPGPEDQAAKSAAELGGPKRFFGSDASKWPVTVSQPPK